MTKANHGGCCGGIFSLGLTAAVLLCLLLQPSTALPASSVEDFTIYALKETTNSSHNNHTIHYDVKLTNSDSNTIYYDALELTIYYKPDDSSSFLIGNTTFIPFNLRRLESTRRVGSIEARGVHWENATVPVTLRVELATSMRYQLRTFKRTASNPSSRLRTRQQASVPSFKRVHYVVGAELKVNDQGSLVNKGIQLVSSSAGRNKGRFQMVGILLGILLIFNSWWTGLYS